MARLVPLWTERERTHPDEVRSFLARHGIQFQTWPLPDDVRKLAEKEQMSDEDKQQLLALFRDRLDRLAEEEGYVHQDVVAVRPFEGVDDKLAKFDRVHYHDDDEVRAIAGGRGVFGFVEESGRQFLLEIEAGEYISVPAGMWHWFYVFQERHVTAIRLFRDPEGWVPHYRFPEPDGSGS